MFAPIPAIFAVLLFASTLPNGIHVSELPARGDTVEIIAGYASPGLSGLASTTAARSLELNTYSAGGTLEFFQDLDRTGIKIRVPQWAAGMFDEPLAGLFKEVPRQNETPSQPADDFRSKVEDEIRAALLAPASRSGGEYSTDLAFVLTSGAVSQALRDGLAAIPKRASDHLEVESSRLPAERLLRFESDLPAGAVILAAPVPTVYYKEWYLVFLLDRLIHRVMPLKPQTKIEPSIHPYYYRLEVAVPAGQFADPVQENMLQEIQRLQFTRAEARDLDAAKADARAYLESPEIQEWFESVGIPERRVEGLEWIQAMTADDMRVAARDLVVRNHVVASWSPKAKQTAVDVEDLRSGGAASLRPSPAAPPRPLPVGEAFNLAQFPTHTDRPQNTPLAEKLGSGVSLVASDVNAVFVSGSALTRLDKEPDADTVKAFQNYRAERILVLARTESMEKTRQLWNSFKGSTNGEVGVPKGNISTGDLPALVILKTLVDRKLFEAGLWPDVQLTINASDGSTLGIRADAENRMRIVEWIKSVASDKPSDADMAWAREVAMHRFAIVGPDLQALTWERDPQGAIQDLQTVSAGHVQDVARIYF